MLEKRKKNSIRNLIFGIINKLITLFIPFLLIAVIKKTLGTEYVGLNNLFSSLLQMLTLAEMGLGSAMVYEMYKPIIENDKKMISSLINLYKKIYKVLSCMILLIGLLCIPFLNYVINGDVPKDLDIRLLFVIYLLNTVLSYSMFAYKKSILQAYQRNDLISKVSSITHVIMYISQFIVLIALKNYYLYVLTLPITTLLDNILVNYIVKKMYKDIKPEGTVDNEKKKEIFTKVRSLAGHKIGAIIISSLDSIVISSFLGLKALAIYSCYFYIIKALNGFINIGFNSIIASIGNSIVLESKERNNKLFDKLNLILIWIVGFSTTCLFVLYQPFIEMWMGAEFLLPIQSVILFSIYFYTWQGRVMGLAFKDAAGMWNEDFWKPYIGIIINLVTNIILVKYIGLNGVIISTIIVMVFVYFPWETKVIYQNLFQNSSKKHVKRMIFNFVLTILITKCTYGVCILVKGNDILSFIEKACICFVIPNVIYWIVYHKTTEYKEIIFMIKEMLNKFKSRCKYEN